MSLWTKPLSEVTFEDVEAFCDLRLPEGTEVDYKREVPSDLAKTVSAFANTAGGLILLGVDEDDQGKPVVPIVGMARERGISERITQICRDGISPSVYPEISSFLELPGDSQRGVMVVRVARSPHAPHAIRNRTRVYVRTGNVGDAFELADVDRVAAMLRGREHWEQVRNQQIESCIDRYLPLSPVADPPLCWAAVIPLYPSRDVCLLKRCRLESLGLRKYRTDGGATGIRFQTISGEECASWMQSISTLGSVVEVELILNQKKNGEMEVSNQFYMNRPISLLVHACRKAKELYKHDDVDIRGPLRVALGFMNVRGGKALDDDATPQLDNHLRFEQTIQLHEFDAIDFYDDNLSDLVYDLASQAGWAFNCGTLFRTQRI